ncbi:MAG: CBS domain-containing protein, partial [Woeseia sp.]
DCMKVVLTSGYHGEPGGPVSDLMVTDVKTVDASMSIFDLAELFMKSGYRRYPVMKENRLVGQISRRDVLRALGELSIS